MPNSGRHGRSERPTRTLAPAPWRWPAGSALYFAGIAGAATFAMATNLGRDMRALEPFMADIERAAVAIGLGLDQVSISGHRYTRDGDVFDALRLGEQRSLVSFDVARAKAGIEALPWVERATITRIIPNGIAVAIDERAAAAIWWTTAAGEGRGMLLDRDGRHLGWAGPDVPAGLYSISGEGADDAVAGLLDLLAGAPGLADKIASIERVGRRRWTLHLTNGLAVHLPAAGEGQALTTAAHLLATGIGADAGSIDLRVADRIVVRSESAAPTTSTLSAKVASAALPVPPTGNRP